MFSLAAAGIRWLQWCRAAIARSVADAQASMIGRQEANPSYLQAGAGDGGPEHLANKRQTLATCRLGLAAGVQSSSRRGCRAAAISLSRPGVPVCLRALHLRVQGSVPCGCSSPAGVLQGWRLLVLVLVLLGCHLRLHVLGLQAVGPRSQSAKSCRASASSCWC